MENQDRSNLILLRKDQSRKSKLLLIGKLIAYRLIPINILFESIYHVKQFYYKLDYVVMNLTQFEWVKTELKRRRYHENSVGGSFVNNPN